uniref:MalT-like TPR region domain-containing protein n=1 Tax=Grammatophora oceanica TaxID=210454 RepID=A0A7S1UWG8_9STRA|mmetsp:Transcript_27147/g.39752  ORF Transcript_27147/g.39752 Transcript_27147/m.39752 type:complete len:514 (+) Transcript_27147:93-1634(+)
MGNYIITGNTIDLSTLFEAVDSAAISKEDATEALERLQHALDTNKSDHQRHPDSTLGVAQISEAMGKLHWQIGDLEVSLEKFQMALDIRKQRIPNSILLATTHHQVGQLQQSMGKLEDALSNYSSASRIIRQEDPNSLLMADNYNHMGLILKMKGDLLQALKSYRLSLGLKKALAPDSLTLCITYVNIGHLMRQLDCIEDAMHCNEHALRILRLTAPTSRLAAVVFCNTAELFLEMNKPSSALVAYTHAVDIEEERIKEDTGVGGVEYSLIVANVYTKMGHIYRSHYKRKERALQLYRRAQSIYQKQPKATLPLADACDNVASMLGKDDYERDILMRQAVAIRRRIAEVKEEGDDEQGHRVESPVSAYSWSECVDDDDEKDEEPVSDEDEEQPEGRRISVPRIAVSGMEDDDDDKRSSVENLLTRAGKLALKRRSSSTRSSSPACSVGSSSSSQSSDRSIGYGTDDDMSATSSANDDDSASTWEASNTGLRKKSPHTNTHFVDASMDDGLEFR